ncbi:kinase-like protein, partial [Macrolepiota fuliginosa MF-IS2]
IHDIISGLEYLHSNHVVHGNLKGVNVLVNASQRACLADFGLSTIRDDNALPFTQATNNNSAFEVRWTAPEMLKGSGRSKESDIWTFGSVCYEALTRKAPYHEYSTDLTIMYRIMERGLPTRPEADPNSDMDQINDKMWALMERCWNTEASGRPQSSDI